MTALSLAPQMLDDSYYPASAREKIKEIKNADKYVGEFPAPGGSLDINWPMMVFWQAEKHPEFGNNYFGVYRRPAFMLPDAPMQTFICNADWVAEETFVGIMTDEGLVYSTYPHDMRGVAGGHIDGGCRASEWSRSGGAIESTSVSFKVVNGEIVEAEDEDA